MYLLDWIALCGDLHLPILMSIQLSVCNGGQMLYAFNPMTGSGASPKPTCLPQLLQTLLLPIHDHTHSRILLMLTKDLKVHSHMYFMYLWHGELVCFECKISKFKGGWIYTPLCELLPPPPPPIHVTLKQITKKTGDQLPIIVRGVHHSL